MNKETVKLFCGFDWATQKHYFVLKDISGEVLSESYLDNSKEGFNGFLTLLDQHRNGQPIALIFEATRGAILNVLVDVEWLILCPVNPIKTKKLNELDGSSMGKSDPRDAHLLCDHLRMKGVEKLKGYVEKDPIFRELQQWVSLENDLTAQRTECLQRIHSHVNGFCPELKAVVSKLESAVYRDYLLKFSPLRPASEEKVRNFLYKNNLRRSKVIDEFIAMHKSLTPLGTQKSFHVAQLETLRSMVRLYCSIQNEMTHCESKISELFWQIPQAEIYASQPSVGKKIAPRLACLFGSRPQEAYKSKQQAAAYLGQSPITKSSGGDGKAFGKKTVTKRYGCYKRGRHVMYLWSRSVSMGRGDIPQKQYLQKLKAKGDKAPTRYRKLGKKLIAMLYKCLIDNEQYSETIYNGNLHQGVTP